MIEVVQRNLTPHVQQAVIHVIEQTLNATFPATAQVVWRYFFYTNSTDRFVELATLHTIPIQNTSGGTVVTIGAGDCYLKLTEFDTEFLSFGQRPGIVLEAIEAVNGNGQPLLPYQAGANYTWIEVMGGSYSIQNTRSVRNSNPLKLELTTQ